MAVSRSTYSFLLTPMACIALLMAAACDDDTKEPTSDVIDDVIDDVFEDADATEDVDLGIPEETPGTIEELGIPEMDLIVPAHEAAAPTDEEIVIYYYRPDGEYEDWGVWLWAYPGGDGADHWAYTQDLEVVEGVGYLKFRQDGADIGEIRPLGPDNQFGFIIRMDAEWVKDGDEDRIWDADTSNEVVVISGDQNNYPYGPYVPTIDAATMATTTTIEVTLSGRHALELYPDDNGFVVRHADESRTYEIADVQNADSLDDRTANYADALLVTLAEEAELGPALVIEHPEYLEPAPINNIDLIVAAAEATVPDADYALGAIYSSDGSSVEFRVWSPLSTSVIARLYETTGADEPDYEVELTLDGETGVWSGTFDEVDPDGMFYDYLIANRAGENPCLDPYARSMDAYLGEGGAGRAAIVDLDSDAATPEGWADDAYYVLENREDAIIYEIHVRDFTIAADSGVTEEPGTYRAFIEKLPYLQDLGVTHIQLLPVYNFYYTDETDRAYEDAGTASNNNYNWGYDPHNWLTPEGWYASDPTDPYSRVLELRELVQAIHDHDMAVLLDVTFNHYGSPFILNQVAPDYYFRTNANGSLTSASGTGNDIASTRIMARRLIVDASRHWVESYHVDGFRFDLMGLIDSETMELAHAACVAVNEHVLFEGEGWKMYNGPPGTVGLDQNYMDQTDDIAVFNDEIRDLLKGGGFNDDQPGFITGASGNIQDIFLNLIGQPQSNYTADDPGDSLAYIAAHDNLTLHDNVAFNTGLDDDVPEERQEIIDRIEMGNFLILTSQSIAFLHGGQERARSKPALNATTEVLGGFVRNSYDSSDNINEFPWTLDEPAQELVDFTRGLIWLRRNTPAFRLGDMEAIDAATARIELDDSQALGYSVTVDSTTYFILANANDDAAVTFDLGVDVTTAAILVDSDEANHEGVAEVSGVTVDSNEVTLAPLSQALLRLAGE